MAFDFATLNRAGGSLYKPRILGYSRDIIGTELGNRTAERDAFSEQGQRARLAELSQQDMANEQMQREREVFELAKRQKEKEEYAKWEKEQILNQVASQLYSDKKANGDYGAMLSPSQQLAMAAKEAARRGQGGYAQEFMAQAQGLAAKEQQAALDAEETRLENEKIRQQTEELRRKNEATSRDSGLPELADVKRADDIFNEYTKDSKGQLDQVKIARELASSVKQGNPDADVQLNTILASLFQGSKLSNEDIRRVGQAGSLPTRVLNSLSRWTEGTPIDLSIDQKVKLIDLLEKSNAEKYNQSVDKAVNIFKKSKGLSEDIIGEYAGRKYTMHEADKATELSPIDQQALEWANQNKNDPRAKQILNKLGM